MKNSFYIVLPILACVPAFSQTPEELIKKAQDQLEGDTGQGTLVMKVVTPDYMRTLEMETWWVGHEKSLTVIKSPKKEAGNKWLKIENELWSYLRNTETTIKLPPSMMLQSWNGSDFTNDDLMKESSVVEDYQHEIIGEELVGENQCWKLKLTPKPEAPVVWGTIYYWIRQEDYLPSLIDYYDEKGKLMRSMEYSDFKVLGGRKIPATWTMKNRVKEGRSTEIRVTDMEYNKKISDRIFSFRELERGR